MSYRPISEELNRIIANHIDYINTNSNNALRERNDAIENYDMMFDNGPDVKNLLKLFDEIINELGITDIQRQKRILINMFKLGFGKSKQEYKEIADNSGEGPSNAVLSTPVTKRTRSEDLEPPEVPRKMTLQEQTRRQIVASLQKIDEEYIMRAQITTPPATKKQKDLKRTSPLKYYNQNDDCVICLESLNNGNKVCMIYECEHLFHCKCLKNPNTKEYYKTCPLCRKQFLPDNVIKDIKLRSQPSGSTTTDGKSGGVEPGEEVNSFGKSILSDLRYLKSLRTKVRKVGR
jgi:hypothetical protein